MLNPRTILGGMIIFLAGAAVGYAVDYWQSLNRISKIVDEASEELREMYERKSKETKNDEEVVEESSIEPENVETVHTNYGSDIFEDLISKPSVNHINESIRVIAPTEIGFVDDYDIVSVNIYSDGTVMDDLDQPVEFLEDHIGDALNHIGEYSPDCVYVANDDERVYYEVIMINSVYVE